MPPQYTWETAKKRTRLSSQADSYLAARDAPNPDRLPEPKLIKVKFPGTCGMCRAPLWPGDSARWYGRGLITCRVCE